MDTPIEIITPDALKEYRVYEDKRNWLVERGYIKYLNDEEIFPLVSVSILSGLPEQDIARNIVDGHISGKCYSLMRDKGLEVAAEYGTNDFIELLYAALSGGDGSDSNRSHLAQPSGSLPSVYLRKSLVVVPLDELACRDGK